MDKYILERDGQLDFYKVFLPRVNPALDIDEILETAMTDYENLKKKKL